MGTADESQACLLQIAFAMAIDFVGRSAARVRDGDRFHWPLRSEGGKYPNLIENSLHLMLIAQKSLPRRGGRGGRGGGGDIDRGPRRYTDRRVSLDTGNRAGRPPRRMDALHDHRYFYRAASSSITRSPGAAICMDALISARPRSSSIRRRRAFEIRVTTVPTLPARPVRPERCR